MRTSNLKSYNRGWMVGDFSPSIFKTDKYEVCIKRLPAGFYEEPHFHKLTTEITTIIFGRVKMNGVEYKEDDIILIEPNEVTDFLCLTDVVSCATRDGSFPGDRYLASENKKIKE